MKTKKIFLILSLCIFFAFVWFMQNNVYIGDPTDRNLISMNNSAFGYSSLMAYMLFYPLPFLLLFNMFYQADNIMVITRFPKRWIWYRLIIIKIMFLAFIYAGLHTLVNIFFTLIFFNIELLRQMHFFYIALANMFVLTLFFSSIGIINRLITDLINKSVGLSMFFSYMFIGILYFIEKLIFPSTPWAPLKDLALFYYLLNNEWNMMHFLLVFTRQVLIVVLLYLIGSWAISRKDIMND
ncbi:WxPxxD family membrane protein [Terrilactibacillus laevilacticus]|uniref:WxPxxD family membrane protein n=1 Tax=Terrilactibacillus laevilacticus TaxID=1380157 RepID=UPI0011476461|nr:WxPxxD family membrane protein [Terrilactibacillus laevilacticus]